MADEISKGKVVTFSFTLTDDDGEVLDSTSDGVPLAYLHGAENVVPGLEKQLTGKKVGDKVRVDLTPEEGYGERRGSGPQPVPRDSFPEDAELSPGMQFIAEDENGQEMPVWVVEVDEKKILIDVDHPLAGMSLHFDVEVLSVRDATDEEQAHGHPHGPSAHDDN